VPSRARAGAILAGTAQMCGIDRHGSRLKFIASLETNVGLFENLRAHIEIRTTGPSDELTFC